MTMNILEDQVTDLTHLAQAPLTPGARFIGDRMNGQRQSSSAESPADGSREKRKSEEIRANGATHTRAKRNRYISIACNQCKRRKIKCNGNTPCQRCGNLNLECQYTPNCCSNSFKESEEFRQMNTHLASLQEQVENLYADLNALRSGGGGSISDPQPAHISPMTSYQPMPKHATFRGPTSSTFSLETAKNNLHKMGYQGLTDDGILTRDVSSSGSPSIRASSQEPSSGIAIRNPLLSVSKDESIRLCHVYEEQMGLMYPIVDIERVIIHAGNVYNFSEATIRTALTSPVAMSKGINDDQSLVLMMVLACAALVEGSGRSEIALRLFESVRESADRILHSEVIQVKNLPFLVLVTMYHFHCDEEALAWRLIGQVARMCMELGLHRRDSLFKATTDTTERSNAVKLFWSIYVLDRRWSFGTGMPFALQDSDIDPNLPEPGLSTPYLNAMIAYSRIASKVWRIIQTFPAGNSPSSHPFSYVAINTDELNYLNYQVLNWQNSLPPLLRRPKNPEQDQQTPYHYPNMPSHHDEIDHQGQSSPRGVYFLRTLLYLRASQMRMQIYTPLLHSSTSIAKHHNLVSSVVELAKDTIRVLTNLNRTTDIYRLQQVCFNYFLVSALAVIFLAGVNGFLASSSNSAGAWEEFYMALDLVKGFSRKSFVSKRLWKTIKGLKEIVPKVDLPPGIVPDRELMRELENSDSTAALAMACLEGHEVTFAGAEELSGLAHGAALVEEAAVNGFQMSAEMMSLFEAALGGTHAGSGGAEGTAGYSAQISDSTAADRNNSGIGVGLGSSVCGGNGSGSQFFGGDEELFRQLRDLF